MIDMRTVIGTEVTIKGAKNEPCTKCGLMQAQYPVWVSDAEMDWMCTFCETGYATPAAIINTATDDLLD